VLGVFGGWGVISNSHAITINFNLQAQNFAIYQFSPI